VANKTKDEKEKDTILRWRTNPLLFVREAIGAVPTNQQEEVLAILGKYAEARIKKNLGVELTPEEDDLAGRIGISIRSGRGLGKDVLLAWINIWFFLLFPGAKGIVTAPTAVQLDAILWSEIKNWINWSGQEDKDTGRTRGAVLGRYLEVQAGKFLNKAFKEEKQKDTFLIPRTSNKRGEGSAEPLQGCNGPYIILEADEATGVPDSAFSSLEGSLSGLFNFVVLISNMTRISGYFHRSHFDAKISKKWLTFHWDCEKSNIDEVRGNTSMKNFIASMEDIHGRESNWFRIHVNGRPPKSESDTLIPREWVEAAVHRCITPAEAAPVMMGVDVGSGSGGDESVMVRRKGGKVFEPEASNEVKTDKLSQMVAMELRSGNIAAAMIDVIGVGTGVYDSLVGWGFSSVVHPVNASESAYEDTKFFQRRDELWWKMRERFEKGTISIPEDEILINQISDIKYGPIGGRIKVESKKDMKRRGVGSPDRADALMMTLALPDEIFEAKSKSEKDAWDDAFKEQGSKSGTWMSV